MDLRIILIFCFGLVGGMLAFWLGVPMPFMLGGIFGTASFIIFYERTGRRIPKLSRWLRLVFMSIIGSMIGSRFSPELLTLLPQFWLSALALIPFIFLAHGGSYLIMRRLGGYGRLDAYFASLPGGIVDSVALAEQMGADLKIVTTQHFIRIILVVASVPVLFFVVEGHAVGSAAGASIAAPDYEITDIILLLTIAFSGLFLGRLTKLPASHMMGPLFIALALSVSGTVQIDTPFWLSHLAQYVVGTALGAQFSGVSSTLLTKGLRLGLIVGTYMLTIGAALALLLENFVPAGFGALFVSFAAGGLAEMSLIALSLNFNPVIVALHHLFRIFLTVSLGSYFARHIFKLGPKL
jgi:membrane AbrB-like protein